MSAIQVYSETAALEGVLLHPPGPEVENMTPKNAERALYSDILNLSVARREYNQLECLLQHLVPTLRVKDYPYDLLLPMRSLPEHALLRRDSTKN